MEHGTWPDGHNERCCGFRKGGGIYWEMGRGPGGKPPEYFMIDPPLVIPPAIVVPAQGVTTLVDPDGVTHLLAHIGRTNYPTPLDYFEEYAALGVSWRIPVTAPFVALTINSKLILAHDRGRVLTPGSEYAEVFTRGWFCPHSDLHPEHAFPTLAEPCAGLWRETLPNDGRNQPRPAQPFDSVWRYLPSTTYRGRIAPPAATYEPALCFKFSLGRFVTVEGEDGAYREQAEQRAEKIAKAGLPVAVVEV